MGYEPRLTPDVCLLIGMVEVRGVGCCSLLGLVSLLDTWLYRHLAMSLSGTGVIDRHGPCLHGAYSPVRERC